MGTWRVASIQSTSITTVAEPCRCTVTWQLMVAAGLCVSLLLWNILPVLFFHSICIYSMSVVSNNLSNASTTGVPETKHRQIRFHEALERLYERLWRTERWILARYIWLRFHIRLLKPFTSQFFGSYWTRYWFELLWCLCCFFLFCLFCFFIRLGKDLRAD